MARLRFVAIAGLAALAALIAAGAYAYGGWRDAAISAPMHKAAAQTLIAEGRGGARLGARRRAILILVEDPKFFTHNGVDFTTPGAGATTITQALAKRLAFEKFRKGLPKIRQTAYALSLENHLSKDEILALFLDRAPMGPGPDGRRITGFHRASVAFFGAAPAAVADEEYLALVAILIAPDALALSRPSAAREERVRRIARIVAGACAPRDHSDVWLKGCA